MNNPLDLKPLKNFIEYCEAQKIKPTKKAVVISIGEQKLFFFSHDVLEASYPVSTSKEPPCCNENSFGTPIGLHKIEEKIGSDAPIGTVFLNRECTNRHFSEFPQEESEKNLITSRILWLRGLEPGRNSGPGCDSYSRYIYLHGTNHEDRLGEPQSDGCVHLANRDIITLFNAADIHTLVWIG